MPETSYGWESISRLLADDLEDIAIEHWWEVALDKGRVPLNPDWALYQQLERIGVFKAFVCRVDGALAGYVWFFLNDHIHYKTLLHATCDVFYLRPGMRRGLTGYTLFRLAEKALAQVAKERGRKMVRISLAEKLHLRAKLQSASGKTTIGRMFERLGYKPVETAYWKLVEV
ncbi:MAG: hypothetical protein AABZ67_00530 [Pseudomonadota bacterium]